MIGIRYVLLVTGTMALSGWGMMRRGPAAWYSARPVMGPAAPVGAIDVANSGYPQERSVCLSVKLGPNAATDCGDLRVVQTGRRPALVLSPAAYNARVGLALVCPITSQVKGYPFEVVLPGSGRLRAAVLADQVKSLDWRSRRAQRLGRVPPELIEQVIARIEALLRG